MSHENKLCVVKASKSHGPAPIPVEGKWVAVQNITDISGVTHGCGKCAPQMGTCKLTLNVKAGIIQEALIETTGCSGITQAATMAVEVMPGKNLLEILNTDLLCDAINESMRQLFNQMIYGRSQTSYSLDGLAVGACWEDLGAGAWSQVGTTYGTLANGPRYLAVNGGYVTRMALDEKQEVIGYEYVNIAKLMSSIDDGKEPNQAYTQALTTYGRFSEAKKYINPRKE